MRRALVPAGLSILIELLQYVFKIGHCDIDDVISNTIGGLIGIGLGWGRISSES